jgi:hypothetical protein
MSRRAALVAGAVAALVVVGVLVVPFATRSRVLPASVPQPSPLLRTAVVVLPAQQSACVRRAAMDQHSEQLALRISTRGRRPVPLSLSISGPGYRAAATLPASYRDNDVVAMPLAPPDGPSRVTICLRNDGRSPVDLYATDEARTKTRVVTTVGGRRTRANPVLTFSEREPASLATRMETSAHRVATFRPGGPWLVWLAVALTVVAVPAALVAALATSGEGRRR